MAGGVDASIHDGPGPVNRPASVGRGGALARAGCGRPGPGADRRYGLGVSIGLPEILVVVLILLLIFGGRRIPELGRALGAGFRNLREAVGAGRSEGIESAQEAPPPPSADAAEDEKPARRS